MFRSFPNEGKPLSSMKNSFRLWFLQKISFYKKVLLIRFHFRILFAFMLGCFCTFVSKHILQCFLGGRETKYFHKAVFEKDIWRKQQKLLSQNQTAFSKLPFLKKKSGTCFISLLVQIYQTVVSVFKLYQQTYFALSQFNINELLSF